MSANSQTSPGLFGSGNQIAFGATPMPSTSTAGNSADHDWSVGGGFEYFWTRNFSSTIYGGYTRISTTAP